MTGRIARWTVLALFLLAGQLPPPQVSARDFPGPWRGWDGELVVIAQGQLGVACVHSGWRPSRAAGQLPPADVAALLACSADGRRWSYLRVWRRAHVARFTRVTEMTPPV